jgi:hypothetical protein
MLRLEIEGVNELSCIDNPGRNREVRGLVCCNQGCTAQASRELLLNFCLIIQALD